MVKDKAWGTRIKVNQMKEALSLFINNGCEMQYNTFAALNSKLKRLLKWFQQQTAFRFIGSSILFIYDAQPPPIDTGTPITPQQIANTATVKLVDFAHTWELTEESSIDQDYIYGLTNLITLLEDIYTERRDESLPEELWISELRRAQRSVLVHIQNNTSKRLKLVEYQFQGTGLQMWGAFPPKEIQPHTSVTIGTCNSGLIAGTHASVAYRIVDPKKKEVKSKCK